MSAVDIESYVARIVADAPPLTDEQRARIAAILGPRMPGAHATPTAEPEMPAPVARTPERNVVIYRHYDACGHLLYVGISNDWTRRTYQHEAKSWWSKWSTRIERSAEAAPNRELAMVFEQCAIGDEAPIFNHTHAAKDRSARIVRYLVEHEQWEHLAMKGVEPADLPGAARALVGTKAAHHITWSKVAAS